jgi:hypothetical protein
MSHIAVDRLEIQVKFPFKKKKLYNDRSNGHVFKLLISHFTYVRTTLKYINHCERSNAGGKTS